MVEASPEILARAVKVKLVVFDVDGVLTDGRLLLGDNGVEYKAFYSRDGHGMKMLGRTGIELAIITGRRSQLVAERMASLGIAHVHQGHASKLPVFEKLIADLNLTDAQAAWGSCASSASSSISRLPCVSVCGCTWCGHAEAPPSA